MLPQAERATLTTGDYSIRGFEDEIAIERKSFDDLYSCLSSKQRRFKAQLKRLGKLKKRALLVDTTAASLLLGHPLCCLSGEEALRRLLSWCSLSNVPLYFVDRSGEIFCRLLLCQFLKEVYVA